MCFGGERRVGIRLKRASYFSFVPSHETPRAPQPTPLSPPKHINNDWVRVCFRPQSSPYFLRKPRTRNSQTNGLEQNKMAVLFCVEHMGWVREGGEWVRLRREAKNTSKKYDRTEKEKIKERKQKRKKMTVSQSKSSWKVSTTKSVPVLASHADVLRASSLRTFAWEAFPVLINNKGSKVLDAQVEYMP